MKNVSLIVFALSLFIVSCGSDKDGTNGDDGSPSTAKFQVRLTDAPADYDEVNVEIVDVQINRGDDDGGGWESLENINSGVFNLLELTAGIDTLLAEAEIPAGHVSQIRLILGEDNTVKIGDEIFKLTTPSAQQSGLKLNLDTDLEAGVTYTFLLDFDAARSVVKAGNSGKYILKPVIRVIAEPNVSSGSISGSVSPPDRYPIYILHQTDTLAASYSDFEGTFVLMGIPAGTYTIKIVPEDFTGLNIGIKDDVAVVAGELTDVGEISLE